MKHIIKWGYLLVLLFILNACTFENIQFINAEHLRLVRVEGKKMHLTFDAIINNPNNFTIKVKPSNFDVYVNGKQLGVAHLDERVKIIKKSESTIAVPVSVELENGALPQLIAASFKSTAEIRVVGTVRAAVSIVSKRKKIDEKREISLRDLKLPF